MKSESEYMQQVKVRVEFGVQVRVKVGDYAERESLDERLHKWWLSHWLLVREYIGADMYSNVFRFCTQNSRIQRIFMIYSDNP